jgi:hypothetical protein
VWEDIRDVASLFLRHVHLKFQGVDRTPNPAATFGTCDDIILVVARPATTKDTKQMAAVGRRTQVNGTNGNGNGSASNPDHDLEDLDAALLQVFIAKRVLNLDDAQRVLETLADVTGNLGSSLTRLRDWDRSRHL